MKRPRHKASARSASLFALTFLLVRAAFANDSTAELATGGLVLTKNEGIEMRAEELFISQKEVRVRYRFFNTTPTAVKVLVAFPMPDIEVDGIDFMTSVPTENAENLLGFRTSVDGAPVVAKVEQKAMKDGVDQTEKLRALKVPIQPHLRKTGAALDRLPKDAQAELVKLNLAVAEDFDAGKGWEHHLAPTWTLKTTYFWEQVFPAQRELAVEHRYKPSVGESAQTAIDNAELRTRYDEYCVDDSFLAAVKSAQARAKVEYAPFTEKRIAYVLKTGANWAAPIADFRLVIDKGKAENLMSFCGSEVRKLNATQFEMRRTNFRPDRDLHILILQPLAVAR